MEEENNNDSSRQARTINQRPIYKRWYFWVIIAAILLGGFAFAWVSGHNQSSKSGQADTNYL